MGTKREGKERNKCEASDMLRISAETSAKNSGSALAESFKKRNSQFFNKLPLCEIPYLGITNGRKLNVRNPVAILLFPYLRLRFHKSHFKKKRKRSWGIRKERMGILMRLPLAYEGKYTVQW